LVYFTKRKVIKLNTSLNIKVLAIGPTIYYRKFYQYHFKPFYADLQRARENFTFYSATPANILIKYLMTE